MWIGPFVFCESGKFMFYVVGWVLINLIIFINYFVYIKYSVKCLQLTVCTPCLLMDHLRQHYHGPHHLYPFQNLQQLCQEQSMSFKCSYKIHV